MDARPEILNHNVETVPRLFKQVQPQDHYEWAAATLTNARKLDPEVLTKSGIMVGLGETLEEVKAVMRDQRSWGVDILTSGSICSPARSTCPSQRYYTLEEFTELKEYGLCDWLQVGGERPAGALFVPRRRAGAGVERRASPALWRSSARSRGLRRLSLDKRLTFVFRFLLLASLLSACGFAVPGLPEEPTLPPQAIYTSAAKTAEARRIERFAQTATMQPGSLIETSAGPSQTPTQAPVVPTTTPAVTPTGNAPASAVSTGGDRGEFVSDVSVPDGTAFAPNEFFQKGWQIMNSGQTTWTTDYSLVFIDGALMGAPASVPLPKEVAPGEKVEITIDMVAPPDPGPYRGYWELRNASGKVFGFGTDANEFIWVDIVVQSGAASAGETATPGAGGAIADVALSVDNAEFSGTCPHTFIFTVQITLNKPATVSYSLEAGSKSGEEIRLPLPAAQNLATGTHSIVYEVTVPSNVIGWARLHITHPSQAFSNQVDFILTCE